METPVPQNPTAPAYLPASWRDVYQLVADSREQVLGAVAVVQKGVDALAQQTVPGIASRVTAIEQARLIEVTQRNAVAQQVAAETAEKIAKKTVAESYFFHIPKSTWTLIIAAFAAGGSIISVIFHI